MKILMLTWHYSPAVGGAEKQAERLANVLAQRGHEIEIWTSQRPDAPAVERTRPGITIRRCFWSINWGPVFGITALIQAALMVWLARKRFDIIHSHQCSWSALGACLARRAGGPPVLSLVISSGAWNDLVLVSRRKGGPLLLWGFRRCDCIIALCRQARQELIDLRFRPDQIRILANGVDLETFHPPPSPSLSSPPERGASPPASATSPESPGILYVGRFHALKGVDVLLKAFAQVLKQEPSARLLLGGDGNERQRLDALVRELGLRAAEGEPKPGEVGFLGMLSDTPPRFRAAGVAVLPSRTEGMSNVMLEAMASGCAIAATAVGGNPDLLDPEDLHSRLPKEKMSDVFVGAHGVLVPPENPEALAKGILVLLKDNELRARLGASARRYVETHCDLDVIAAQYENLYKELTSAAVGAS